MSLNTNLQQCVSASIAFSFTPISELPNDVSVFVDQLVCVRFDEVKRMH